MLGLRFCARAFSSRGKREPLFIAVCGPLTIPASLVVEHRLQTHRLSSCGSRAQLLRGMWDLPRPGLEPMSPALAGRFSTTAPPGKPKIHNFKCTSWWLLKMYIFMYHHCYHDITLFYHTQKFIPLCNRFPPPCHLTSGNHWCLFYPYSFPLSRILYECNLFSLFSFIYGFSHLS